MVLVIEPGEHAVEGVIPDISEQSADEQSGVEVITTASIQEEVAIEEVVVVSEPEEQAIKEVEHAEVDEVEEGEVVSMEEVTIVNSVEMGPEIVAIEGVIPDIGEPSADEPSEFEVITVPIEAEAAIKEVVVVTEPEKQSMEECQQRPSAIAEIPVEAVLVVQPIEEEVAMEEVGVIQPIQKEVAMEEVVKVKHIEAEEQEVVVMEGVISDTNDQSADHHSGVKVTTIPVVKQWEEVIVVNPVIAGPKVLAMADMNEVKRDSLQEEEHIAHAGIQVKDIAHYTDAAGNRCTRDCMMNLAGYDPGGLAEVKEAWRFKQGYVRREEKLRLKQNIAGISLNASAEALGHRDTPAITASASHKPFSAPVTNPRSVGLIERNVQLILAGLRAMVGSDVCVGSRTRTSEDKAIQRWDGYLDGAVHAINTWLAIKAMWSSLMDRMFGTPKEEPILRAKLPRYVAPELGDLVLRRRFQVDKSLGMKLHAKWDGPYLLSRISKSGVSGDLEDLKSGKVIGRYAFESLKVYVP